MGSCSLCLTLFQRDSPQRDPMDSVARPQCTHAHTTEKRVFAQTHLSINRHFLNHQCVNVWITISLKWGFYELQKKLQVPFKIHYTVHYAVYVLSFNNISMYFSRSLCLWCMKWNTCIETIYKTTISHAPKIILSATISISISFQTCLLKFLLVCNQFPHHHKKNQYVCLLKDLILQCHP